MTKFCFNCGNPIEEEDVFCYNCGAKLDSPASVQPEQTQTQSYGDAYTQPPQQSQQPHQPQQSPKENIPYQQLAQPYPQYGNQQPPKKNNTALIISLIITGVVVIASVVVFLIFFLPKMQHGGNSQPTTTTYATENVTEAPSEEPTEAPTEEPTEKPTKPATKLPYTDSLGKIENYDFAWISDAMSGSLDGSFLSKDELLGKWKGEFIFDGIWELVYITIDTDGTVTVQPYKINYGDGWEDESGNPSYDFSGSFDINRVYGSGSYGKIDIYEFIVSNGTQYGIGGLKTKSGNKAEVYLVRP